MREVRKNGFSVAGSGSVALARSSPWACFRSEVCVDWYLRGRFEGVERHSIPYDQVRFGRTYHSVCLYISRSAVFLR